MHKQILVILAAAMALVPLASDPVAAQRQIASPPGPWQHRIALVNFPAQVGDMTRTKIHEFDFMGSDAAVGYRLPDNKGEITLYVYPTMGNSCSQSFEGAKSAISNRGGKLLSVDGAPQFFDFPDATEHFARFSIPANSYGHSHPEMVSDLWVSCLTGGQWIVKYRGSFRVDSAQEADRVPAQLLAGIDWSEILDGY